MTHLNLLPWLLAIFAAAGTLSQSATSKCKAYPGDAEWPTADAWLALNASVYGRLLQPLPPAAACHPTSFGPDVASDARCASVKSRWDDEFFHASDPVSVEWQNWANDTCLPDAAVACSTVGYPAYVINATTATDVQVGISFAKYYGVRLIVKNSGHDYVGRSSGGGALSIWVHNLQGIEVHSESKVFTPKGCDAAKVALPGLAITALAGTSMVNAYKETAKYNATVVGGNGRTVALGGFLTGGGHSILAPRYGLATDRVVEMEVITPDGEIKTVNECQDQELFWAFRGGGGSTFGVLLSATMMTVPSPQVLNLVFALSTPSTSPLAWDAIAYFVSRFPSLADAGVSGYPIIFREVVSTGSPPGTPASTGIIGNVIMLDTADPKKVLDLVNPLFAYINATYSNATAGGWSFFTNATMYPNFGNWYDEHFDPSPVGTDQVMGSRLLDAKALGVTVGSKTESDAAQLTKMAAALKGFTAPNGGTSNVFIVSGKGVHEWEANVRGAMGVAGTAVCPAWRRTYVHATSTITFPAHNLTARASAFSDAERFAKSLRDLAPDTGAYMNEANRDEPNWQQTFWGENYARLLGIKKKVDPGDIFWCHPCVGSEGWQLVDDRLCRV